MIVRRVVLISSILFVVAFFLNATVVAKQAEFKDRFVGRWQADKEKTKKYASEHENIKSFPEEVLESLPNMSMEFLDSGKSTATFKNLPNDESVTLEGNWDVIEEFDQNRADVKITMKVDRGDDAKIGTAEFLDDDTLVLLFEDEPSFVLVRSVDEPKKKDGQPEDKEDKQSDN